MKTCDGRDERVFLLECIKVYKSLPALWKVKSPLYRNKHRKRESYRILTQKFQERYPNATRDDVTKKINCLRTNFRKELRRMENNSKYETSCWYFDEMSFLINRRDEISEETEEENDESQNITVEIPNEDCKIPIRKSNKSTMPEDTIIFPCDKIKNPLEAEDAEEMEFLEELEQVQEQKIHAITPKKTKSSNMTFQYEPALICNHRKDESEYDKIANIWSLELKKMTPDQQIYAKRAINEILYEGQLGNLHRDSIQIYLPS